MMEEEQQGLKERSLEFKLKERPVKSEGRAQSNKVGRLWFWGVDAQEYPGGLPRLDPAFVYIIMD